jgi:hypothetical protein
MSLAVVAPFPKSALTRGAVALRVRLRRHHLQAALADGADPWGSPELMQCAAELTAIDARRKLAEAIDGLICFADHPRTMTPLGRFPRAPVLRERTALLDLADRLRAPAPVSVMGVALVAELLCDGSGPLHHPEDHAEDAISRAVDRCWQVLAPTCPL